ncbi:MAG: TIGR04283 family arsenosugar biosynthesis glycosyltransferase [Phycisphaerae bacterium]
MSKVAVIIPALNEEQSIGQVVAAIPTGVWRVIVVDNGSTDATAERARSAGATVVDELCRGYGAACQAGITAAAGADILVFMDADGADDPSEMEAIVKPLVLGNADLVIGSRVLGRHQAGSLTTAQRFGNHLACVLMRWLWGASFTDLGPFRAISAEALKRLDMDDLRYGWTIQMQIRALRRGLRCQEIPVSYRRRIGVSKISGTIRGVIGAGMGILGMIAKEALSTSARHSPCLAGQQSPLVGPCWTRSGRCVKSVPLSPTAGKLVVFLRYPRPGHTKTRLVPVLGPDGAADIQRAMSLHTLAQARQLAQRRPVDIELRYCGGSCSEVAAIYGRDIDMRAQGEGDLGDRMYRACAEAFGQGAARVVIVGTDCPEMNADMMARAFDSLKDNDLVIGPATDGGYYLIGMRRPIAALFSHIAWGTEVVLAQTMAVARDLALAVHLLDPLHDVDRPADITIWQESITRQKKAQPELTVIIPALNEEDHVLSAIESVRQAENVETIVVDGGSSDQTVALARQAGVILLDAPPGRAVQMNAGAAVAHGRVILFLHADTHLPPGYDQQALATLRRPDVTLGAFRLRINSRKSVFRLIEMALRLRGKLLKLPYGDQAMFMSTRAFHAAGGFPLLPILEDVELVRRLARCGRIVVVPLAVATSPRRWLHRGIWRTTLNHQLIIAGYYLGVSPNTLARLR